MAVKQWGYIQIIENSLYPLPISFNNFYTGVASPDTENGGIIGVYCGFLDKIRLYTTVESYKRYIVIGK